MEKTFIDLFKGKVYFFRRDFYKIFLKVKSTLLCLNEEGLKERGICSSSR
jgi:hypothetical protein